MTDERKIQGHCLCGAVTVTATVTAPFLRACHCDMCRRHTSSMFMSMATEGDIRIEGPATSFQSSDWAERGFCSTCGSTLWYGTTHDGARHLSAGLFADAVEAPLKLEFFTDAAPGYALEGTHRKMTTDETIALFAPDEGETP